MKTAKETPEFLEETKIAMKVVKITVAIAILLIMLVYLMADTPDEKLIGLFSFLTIGSFIIAFGMLGRYGAKFVDKNWRRHTLPRTRKRLVAKMIFCLWLMAVVSWGDCGHRREKDNLKQKQEEKITVLEQRYRTDVFILQAKVGILSKEQEIVLDEKIVKILNSKRFWYFPWQRLKNIREILEVR